VPYLTYGKIKQELNNLEHFQRHNIIRQNRPTYQGKTDQDSSLKVCVFSGQWHNMKSLINCIIQLLCESLPREHSEQVLSEQILLEQLHSEQVRFGQNNDSV
jgi:hypothetical protein